MVVTLVLAALGVLVLGVLGALAVTAVQWRKLMIRRRVMVNLTSGRAVEGVLVRRHRRTIVVQQSRVHEPGTEPAAMDGAVVIDRDRIDFIQVAG